MESESHSRSDVSLLYVEDDPGTRQTISSVIASKFPNLSVRTAENGKAGLESFLARPANIVLTDINMPVMNGIQMARQIRLSDPDVDIIAATAHSDTHYLLDAINVGIRRYVLKPVNFKLLFATLDDCLLRITLEERVRSQNDTIRKLSRTVEQSPSMVLITDAKGSVEYANRRFSAVTGYACEEIVGRNLRQLITNASTRDVFDAIWSTITAGSEWRGEIFNRKKDGGLYCEEISISSLLGENGEVTNFVLVMEDISLRKRTEDALREKEYLIEQSQDASEIGSYKAFFASGLWESSAALDRILGIDRSYRRNLPGWLKIVHSDDRKAMGQSLQEKVSRHGFFNKEFKIIRRSDGEIRKVRGLGKVSFDHDGTMVSMIGTIRDITERKTARGKKRPPEEAPPVALDGAPFPIAALADKVDRPGRDRRGEASGGKAERKRLENALQESEQRFTALCDHAPIGIFSTDWEGNNLYSNPVWEEITGQSAAAAKGKGWLAAVHPGDGARLGEAWLKAIVTGGLYCLEHRVITQQGETVWLRSRARNFKGEDGQIRGFIGTVERIAGPAADTP